MASFISRCKRCRKMGLPDGRAKDCGHPEADWYVKYRVGKKQVLAKAGKTKKQAEVYAASITNQLSGGGVVKSIKQMLFSELADSWYQSKSSDGWGVATKYNNHLYLKTYILPDFGNKVVSQIEAMQLENFKIQLLQKLSPSAVAHIISAMRDIFRYGMQFGLVKDNPLLYVKTPSQKRTSEKKFLTIEEVRRLLKTKREPIHTIMTIAIYCGLRLGEIAGLDWRVIDFSENTIAIKKSVSSTPKIFTKKDLSWELKGPKTKASNRVISMSGPVREALLEWQKASFKGHTAVSGFVFPGQKNGAPLTHTIFFKGFRQALVEAGVKQIRFHDLRHTFATIAISQNIHALTLQNMMRHSHSQTTLDTYGSMMPGAVNDGMSKVADAISGVHDTTVIPSQLQVPANNGK